MYFKNPNILFALFALIVPIIVHLFYLRKFQKTYYTNVKFLKKITSETRKSSKLKKYLVLFTRLLIVTFIVLAFAEPSLKKTNLNKESETVLYIDNSISNKEKGEKGEILKVNIQQLLSNYPQDKKINIITNDYVFKNKTIKSIKNELINLKYTSNQLDYQLISLKANKLFSNSKNQKNLICISDFQKNYRLDSSYFDSKIETTLVQNIPVLKSNISIDSVFFLNNNETELNVLVKKQYSTLKSIPISIYNNDSLISKTSVKLSDKINNVVFSLPKQKELNLKINIEDKNGINDNLFYATKNKEKKLNVLAIGNTKNNLFLSRIFTNDEFIFLEQDEKNINYSSFQKQDLIIINEIQKISVALSENLNVYNKNGGNIICIPNEDIDKKSYSKIFNNFKENYKDTRLTNINFSHPIFKNVFEKKISNFEFPFFKQHYKLKNYESKILSLENENPFLVYNNNKYVFAASFNNKNTNFKQSPLIVPTLYKIAKSSLKNNTTYFVIGEENEIEFEIDLSKDEIVTLSSNNNNEFIPLQQIKSNSVIIKTKEKPYKSGIYSIKTKNKKDKKFVAYNYSNSESLREYHNLNTIKNGHIIISNSVKNSIAQINSISEIGTLWKWFIIFALLFLIVELLILKYYK